MFVCLSMNLGTSNIEHPTPNIQHPTNFPRYSEWLLTPAVSLNGIRQRSAWLTFSDPIRALRISNPRHSRLPARATRPVARLLIEIA